MRVNFFCNFKRIAVGKVGVGGRDCQDETVVFADELEEHRSDLHLDVGWLVTHRNLGHARKIDQCQVEHCKTETAITTRVSNY